MIKNGLLKWNYQSMASVQTYALVSLLGLFFFINVGYGQNKNGLQFLSDKKIISFQPIGAFDHIPPSILQYFLKDSLRQTQNDTATTQLIFSGKKGGAAASASASVGATKKIFRPEWTSPMLLDTIKISIKPFGTSFFVYRQEIAPDYPAINFNQFMILDSTGHSLTINGRVYGGVDKEKKLDIKISGRNFLLMNATNAVNNWVFGKAVVNTDLMMKGNLTKPFLRGSIDLNDETDLTFLLPEKNKSEASAKMAVQFIDQDSIVSKGKNAKASVNEMAIDTRRFLNESIVVQTGRKASFKIVVDPNSGDYLQLKGAAKLNVAIDSTGRLLLRGNYVPDSGYYELNGQFLNKRFNFLSGSHIEFNGVPEQAKMNISAAYTIRTSAKNLLGNEVGSVKRTIAKSFNRDLDFNVILFLKGSLNNPAISFDIQLPDSNQLIGSVLRSSINNKLLQLRTDVSATNKQVFALLTMDRFVGEQSTDFFKGNDAGLSDVAKESVSSFLSSVLDHLASDLFKGINADLNLTSFQDFATNDALQQELNVELSKSFLNDRLIVTTGKNFGIESIDGSAKAAQQKGSRFLPDVTTSYKLSADGKYLLRSYTKNQFEVILDGYVMETGVAFLVTMDFEKFKELFLKKDKKSGK